MQVFMKAWAKLEPHDKGSGFEGFWVGVVHILKLLVRGEGWIPKIHYSRCLLVCPLKNEGIPLAAVASQIALFARSARVAF